MNFNYKKARKKIYSLVKEACYSPKNKATDTVWDYHVLPVVKFSLLLGKKLGADSRVLEISALLHDYSVFKHTKYIEEHHIHSGKFSNKILKSFNFPEDLIKHINQCIFSHRGSVKIKKETLEAEILASADAMAHIAELPDMFYLVFGVKKMKTLEGCEWLKKKLGRSWNKIMPEGKEIIADDYKLAMKILNKILKFDK